MGWNGVSDLFDGEVGELKLLAIGVQQFAVLVFWHDFC